VSAVLAAQGLTRRFGDVTAVDDVTFEVRPGEVVGLLGANGAGKTTTIRMLLGLIAPTDGTAFLLGGVPDRGTRRRLGYVPQGLGLYTELTVRQNVAFSAQAYAVPPAHLEGALAPVADRLVRDLPRGLQRQLAFVAALQHDPEVLVLDEPTSGVEPLASARLWDRIRAEAERGAGVLVTTHSMEEARQCDRLLLMAQARLVGSGSERDLVAGTRAVAVVTDTWTEAFDALTRAGELVTLDGRSVRVVDRDPAAVERVLAGAGVTARVTQVPATLEERMAALSA
jgi:ABC-2 type transport system ATP-binding protein/ribosome-dependent ATPase